MPHTPGPWKAERHDAAGDVIIDGAGMHDVGLASVRRNNGRTLEVHENARLIAAAPELLAALEAVCACAQHRGEDSGSEWSAARVVIAKAKGGA